MVILGPYPTNIIIQIGFSRITIHFDSLQLPYIGNALSMVIILPPFEDGSLSETVARMTPEKVQGVMAEIKSGFYKADDLIIQIPKFSIEQVN